MNIPTDEYQRMKDYVEKSKTMLDEVEMIIQDDSTYKPEDRFNFIKAIIEDFKNETN